MAHKIQSFTKAAIGAAAIGAMTLSATPAMARDRHDDDGISAGEIIAGAVVIGGLAAILSSSGRDRYDRYDDRYRDRYDRDRYGYDYRRYGGSRAAVRQCVSAVERGSRRYGSTDVTQITKVDRKRDGYRVRGHVVVRDGYHDRWGRDGYYDRGRFSCDVRYGRVRDIDFSGLR
ncbi:MAG: hypothetical protein U0S50_01075 [Sphingopyxis sp.]|uniref:hypothetical protein n=1 Tax=Sphingopyxis sp. TaxID=1908224 RepID=UPI002ABC62FB|nr:hypothetical protein [Sphingopyxis sp.]MDZ3830391.1 hypothetical protein [Sphingopyxis sp.]